MRSLCCSLRVFALGAAFLLPAVITFAQETVVHGADSIFSGSGVKLAWAVRRGTTEAETSVVIRVMPTDAGYRFIRVDGVDPFTKAHKVFVAMGPLGRATDLAIPRLAFADHPSTEMRFFTSAENAAADRPNLTVFYLGVPDTTPEFTGERDTTAYLDRVLRAKR